MGMFDSFFVHQLGPSTEFQTKDLDCRLDTYAVADSGQVLKKTLDSDDWELTDLDCRPIITCYSSGWIPKNYKLHIRAGKLLAMYSLKDGDWKLIWPKPPS